MGLALQPTRPSQLKEISEAQKDFFDRNGYLILPGFFERHRMQRVKSHIDELWAERRKGCPYVIDSYDPSLARVVRVHFDDADDELRKWPYKLNDLHLDDPIIQNIVIDPRLVRVVADLLSAHPTVCNSFLMERGSEQGPHFDSFYMPGKTLNMMAASWIAIDPVTDSNGPLFYYPKSHLIPPFRFSHGGVKAVHDEMPGAQAHIKQIIREYGLHEERFYPQPGDALIWHSQLLHGGSAITDLSQTRTSLITHYWTTLDYPEERDNIDLGNGRLFLDKPHQTAIRKSLLCEIDAFVPTLTPSAEDLAAVPPEFDPRGYLMNNSDVFRARACPFAHYRNHGRYEGRSWS